MLDGKRIAVVIPAYNEEELLAPTVEGIPGFVDRIYIVDDHSTDATLERARGLPDVRLHVIEHERNEGVGAAIVTGYRLALAERVDVTAVMAADNQMDPEDLRHLCEPVVRGELDYAKANRLFTGQAWQLIPRYRYLGNAVLSLLTKIASGYWHIADSQSGYTAVSLEYLELLDLDRIYKRYGFPNDMLVHLNVWNARVRDIPSRPIYGVGERSGIRLRKVVPTISWLLIKGFFWRLRTKYVIRDFHPLVFFYMFGFLMGLLGLGLGIAEVVLRIMGNAVSVGTVVLVALLLIFGSQFTLFAMWFDMESKDEKRRLNRMVERKSRHPPAIIFVSNGNKLDAGRRSKLPRSWLADDARRVLEPVVSTVRGARPPAGDSRQLSGNGSANGRSRAWGRAAQWRDTAPPEPVLSPTAPKWPQRRSRRPIGADGSLRTRDSSESFRRCRAAWIHRHKSIAHGGSADCARRKGTAIRDLEPSRASTIS